MKVFLNFVIKWLSTSKNKLIRLMDVFAPIAMSVTAGNIAAPSTRSVISLFWNSATGVAVSGFNVVWVTSQPSMLSR